MTSPWRVHANRLIVSIIQDNPNATERRLKQAISQAYPWGERSGHPYKIWLSEVKRLLASGLAPIKAEREMKIRYVLREWILAPKSTALIHYYIDLVCDWCNQEKPSRKDQHETYGCIACFEKKAELDRLLSNDEFMGLLAEFRRDRNQRFMLGIISDWLAEHGFEEVAECFLVESKNKPKKVPL